MQYKEMHSRAMQYYDEYVLKKAENGKEDKQLLFNAYHIEREAALNFIKEQNIEPTRSILLKGAINFAFQLKMFEEANELLKIALKGDPPFNQLQDLYKYKVAIEKNLKNKS